MFLLLFLFLFLFLFLLLENNNVNLIADHGTLSTVSGGPTMVPSPRSTGARPWYLLHGRTPALPRRGGGGGGEG